MTIEFYFQAEKDSEGNPRRVFEKFKMVRKETSGGMFVAVGRVDEDIRKENPDEYAAFRALVGSNEDSFLEQARKDYPGKVSPGPKKTKAVKEKVSEDEASGEGGIKKIFSKKKSSNKKEIL